ncbi:MAG: iron-containing alcohol dehydrogenase [Anaerolineae bacterium]|nr:iron-containing alcohol dehydrogenase [Anaerolineae bacterium]
MEFTLYTPVKLIFGRPVAQALPEALAKLGAQRILLVSDAGLEKAGLVDQVRHILIEAGCQVQVFTGVRSNPTTLDVERALEAAERFGVEAFVALGGGSVIDVAKAAGLLLANGGRYRDYQWEGRPITRPITPLVAVPTTAGTGSEMTRTAVIEDEETRFKKGVVSPYLYARAAVLDPALTTGLPPRLTAAVGADVLGHAIEAYVGRRANPITDALAAMAIQRAWRYLPRAVHDGRDLEARSEMLLASALAGWAFDQSGLGIVHALAGPLAARYELHHGLCIGLLLPYGLAFNLPALGEKRAGLLDLLGLPREMSDEQVVELVRGWLIGLGMPTTLRELNIPSPAAEELRTMAEEASRMAMLPNNPRPASAEDCRHILEQVAGTPASST